MHPGSSTTTLNASTPASEPHPSPKCHQPHDPVHLGAPRPHSQCWIPFSVRAYSRLPVVVSTVIHSVYTKFMLHSLTVLHVDALHGARIDDCLTHHRTSRPYPPIANL
ncbi:hypothetical protein IWX62_002589 [Arthrobacter sp. CAN_A1]